MADVKPLEGEDLLDALMKEPAKGTRQQPTAAAPAEDDPNEALLGQYMKPTAPEAPVASADGRLLSNAPSDSGLSATAKNVGTGIVKGVGDIPGFAGNTSNIADYLLARMQGAITGEPVEKVLEGFKTKDAKYAADVTKRWGTAVGGAMNAVDPHNLPSGADISNPILARTGAYTPTNEIERLIQGGTEAAVGSLAPGVRGPAPNLLTSAMKTLPATFGMGTVGQAATDATGDPLLGMAATAAIPLGMKAAGAASRGTFGAKVDPETAALADAARNKWGIPVNAGQISSSPSVNMLNSVTRRLPFSGAGEQAAEQSASFNRAVSTTFGENATKLTPDVMAAARDRIGSQFEGIAQKTPSIQGDQQLVADLSGVIRSAKGSVTDSEFAPIQSQVMNVVKAFQGGSITGDQYLALTRRGTPLDAAMNSANPNIKNFAGDVRDALDGAFQRSATPDVLDQLQQARAQWKNMRTVEGLAAKSTTGDISPALLQSKVLANNKGTYGAAYGGGGDLKELADIGQRFLKEPPNSGTADRSALFSMLGAAGAAGEVGLASHNPLLALYSLAAPIGTMAAGRAAGSYLRSDRLANSIIDRSLGRPSAPGISNKLLNAIAPYALSAPQPNTP